MVLSISFLLYIFYIFRYFYTYVLLYVQIVHTIYLKGVVLMSKDIIHSLPVICKLLQSDDWKNRVKGEYWLLKDKCIKLRNMLDKYAEGKLDFTPNCSFELLLDQYNHMCSYLAILELRGKIEHIDLADF